MARLARSSTGNRIVPGSNPRDRKISFFFENFSIPPTCVSPTAICLSKMNFNSVFSLKILKYFDRRRERWKIKLKRKKRNYTLPPLKFQRTIFKKYEREINRNVWWTERIAATLTHCVYTKGKVGANYFVARRSLVLEAAQKSTVFAVRRDGSPMDKRD